MAEEFEPLTEDNLGRALAGEPIYLIRGKVGLRLTAHVFKDGVYVVQTPPGGVFVHDIASLGKSFRLRRKTRTVWYAFVEWLNGLAPVGPYDSREDMLQCVDKCGGRILAEHSIELPANG